MKHQRTLIGCFVLLMGWGAISPCAEANSWPDDLRPFFAAHCLDCHRGADSEGGLDLSALAGDLSDAERMRRWVLVHDRLQAGEMPPKDHPQPSPSEKAKAIATLAEALTLADRGRSDVVLRRLNRNEYENTVRDLFDVSVRVKDVLPQDNPTAGFDNVGEGLAVSAEAAPGVFAGGRRRRSMPCSVPRKNPNSSGTRRIFSIKRPTTANPIWAATSAPCSAGPTKDW